MTHMVKATMTVMWKKGTVSERDKERAKTEAARRGIVTEFSGCSATLIGDPGELELIKEHLLPKFDSSRIELAE